MLQEEGGQGHSLEEACLNFGQADRNIQAVLAKGKVLLVVLLSSGWVAPDREWTGRINIRNIGRENSTS